MNPIVYAIPVFFLLMAIEYAVARARGRSLYRSADAINSVSLGTMSQIVGVFTKLFSLGIYTWVYQHGRCFDLAADSALVWIGALIAYDFFYYWHHRLGHEVNVLWAAHVVHHQSQAFNLSTALRQTSTGFLFGWLFYWPLAIAGVPPLVFFVVALIDLLYQYWIHTEQIGRLGWFDRVFASPSNHRVHHGVNDRYVDKNYGGILILWDRLFGTYEDERDDDPVVYGTRSPLQSWNPLWANIDTYADLARDSWRAKSWRDKLRVWVARPGWRPADVAAAYPKPQFRIEDVRLFDSPLGLATRIYCGLQFVIVVALSTYFIATVDKLSPAQSFAYAAGLLVSLWVQGGLLENRRGFRWLEALRLLALIGCVAIVRPALGAISADTVWWATVAAGVAALTALAFLGPGAASTAPSPSSA